MAHIIYLVQTHRETAWQRHNLVSSREQAITKLPTATANNTIQPVNECLSPKSDVGASKKLQQVH